MRFVEPEPEVPPRRGNGKALTMTLRLATVLYWGLGLTLGLAHLRTAGFSEEAWGATLTVWYAEALIFLAVFGGATLVSGIFTRSAARPRAGRLADPLKTSTLSAVERSRGH